MSRRIKHRISNLRASASPVAALVTLLFLVGGPAAMGASTPLFAQATADWCRDADRRDGHCEVRTLTVDVRDGRFAVDARPNGTISVEGWDGSDVQVEARVTTRAWDDADARALAAEVEIVARAGSLTSDGPRTRGRESWSVSYRVRVPHGTDLDLSSTNGGIRVSGVGGSVAARSTNGSIRLSDVSGAVDVRTTNGGIEAALSGSAALERDVELRTTNGGVTVRLPEGTGAQVEARTTNGSIHTDFPLTVQGRLGRRVSGTLGDGGPQLRLTTTNGSIRLQRG
jgi:hypothetical protein